MNKAIIEGIVKNPYYDDDLHCYCATIEVKRTSKVIDSVPIRTMYRLNHDEWIAFSGFVCTDNFIENDRSHKRMYVFGKVAESTNEYRNKVYFDGYLVTKDKLRQTPFGKKIIDCVFAVNLRHRSDYPSCIAWYNNAEIISKSELKSKLIVNGRFQSRQYAKLINDELVEKTAYEICITDVDLEQC